MRKLLIAGAALAALVLAPIATSSAATKPKPTTTTAPTTTTTPRAPSLGVPHVVEQIELDFNAEATVRCPAGEVALSWAVAWYGWNGSLQRYEYGNSGAHESVRPIVENGRPVGYDFIESLGGDVQVHYYVTCAPVVT